MERPACRAKLNRARLGRDQESYCTRGPKGTYVVTVGGNQAASKLEAPTPRGGARAVGKAAGGM